MDKVEQHNTWVIVSGIILFLLLFNIFFEVRFITEDKLVSKRLNGISFFESIFHDYVLDNQELFSVCTEGVTLEHYNDEIWIRGYGYCEVVLYESHTRLYIGVRK
jgi:hypothetical protein